MCLLLGTGHEYKRVTLGLFGPWKTLCPEKKSLDFFSGGGCSVKILIVDDDRGTCNALKAGMCRLGYQVQKECNTNTPQGYSGVYRRVHK